MKTCPTLITNTDNLKSYATIMQKAGLGMKLAAVIGYKFGYGMAKHPNVHRVKRHIQEHPAASLMTVLGIGIGMLGLTGFMIRQKLA
jgi:preprotein translocase subunit Sss1